jgi:hypothetical protein
MGDIITNLTYKLKDLGNHDVIDVHFFVSKILFLMSTGKYNGIIDW